MESLPEEIPHCRNRSSFNRSVTSTSTIMSTSMSTPISTSMSTLPSRSSSGTYLTLPSPRAAMISELAQQNQQITRQRKVAIPLIHSRALSASNMVRSKGFFLGRSNGYLFFSLHFTITQQILAT